MREAVSAAMARSERMLSVREILVILRGTKIEIGLSTRREG